MPKPEDASLESRVREEVQPTQFFGKWLRIVDEEPGEEDEREPGVFLVDVQPQPGRHRTSSSAR